LKKINATNKRILVIPDLHSPYHHIDALDFLKAVKKKFLKRNSIIINVGDEVDNHAISFHDSDSDLFSAGSELKLASNFLQQLNKVFPKMFLCESNHGSLLMRRMKHHGVPLRVLKELKDIYGVTGWSWHHDIMAKTSNGNIYICHGKTSTYNKLSKETGCNAIQGHFHGKFEITWTRTPTTERFNIFSGCLINWESLAFAYGKNHIPKPILGCVMINENGSPFLIKMNLDNKNRWDKKL